MPASSEPPVPSHETQNSPHEDTNNEDQNEDQNENQDEENNNNDDDPNTYHDANTATDNINPEPSNQPEASSSRSGSESEEKKLLEAITELGPIFKTATLRLLELELEIIKPETAEKIKRKLEPLSDPEKPYSHLFQCAMEEEQRKNKGKMTMGITKDWQKVWTREKKIRPEHITQAIHNYHKLSDKNKKNFGNQDAFYPLLLDAYLRQSTPEIRAEIKNNALTASQKWRSPGYQIPRIYPTEKEWKEGMIWGVFSKEHDQIIALMEPLHFNVIQGYSDTGEVIEKYFFPSDHVKIIQNHIIALSKEITQPHFPIPQLGISARLERLGMNYTEASQASALFKIEIEASVLEILSHINPLMSKKAFRNTNTIWRLSMPFWKEESRTLEDINEEQEDRSILRDLPPHIKEKRRESFYIPNKSLTTENQDAWNVRTQTAHRNIGRDSSFEPRTPHMGGGRLRESILGPQYFYKSNEPFTPGNEYSRTHETPQRTTVRPTEDESIWVDHIPGSQDSQQDPEENNNNPRPPFKDPPDPNDPEDPDDNGPPGRGPPRGPPGGGGPNGGGRGGRPFGGPPDPNDPNNPHGNPWIPRRPNRQPGAPLHNNNQGNTSEFRFDKRIKISEVPTWDGNGDTMLDWLDTLNHIAARGAEVFYDLGIIAPLRLTDAAQRWYNALPQMTQHAIQADWGEFKLALSTFFMNDQWYDRMKSKILRARYRQKGHESENPIDYFHRKLRMIQEVFQLSASETILEIMTGAPKYWSVLIDTSRIRTISDLQYYIQYHEQALLRNPETQAQDMEKRLRVLEHRYTNRPSKQGKTFEAEAEANFTKRKFPKKKVIGAHAKFSNYTFPKRDDIVSKGRTPKDKGARACRHCGSLMHWDFDHPFDGNRKDERKAKAFLSTLDSEALEAFVAYEDCYREDSDTEQEEPNELEEEPNPGEFSGDEDFPNPSA